MSHTMISTSPGVFTVMVNFDVTPEEQQQLCDMVQEYIEDFISKQPGFMSATLHKSLCGNHVVNYAQWASKSDFKAFAEKAKSLPVLAKLMQFKPSPVFHQVHYSVQGSGVANSQ